MKIKQKVKEILRDLIGINDFSEEASLIKDLGIDSLGLVTLLIEIEDSFDIELDESDMNPFDLISVSDVIDLVQKYTGESHEKINPTSNR